MGSAAGVQVQQPDLKLYEESHRGKFQSGRVARDSTRTVTTRSVRALALLNHSRHENKYISSEAISSHLIGRRAHGKNDDIEYPPDYKGHRDVKNEATSHHISTIAESPREQASEKEPAAQANGGGGGGMLSMFCSQFNLKLQLEEEEEEENEAELHQYDQRLIEVDETAAGGGDSDRGAGGGGGGGGMGMGLKLSLTTSSSFSAASKAPLMLEGMGVGVAEDGLVRENPGQGAGGTGTGSSRNKQARPMKLPMKERLMMLCKLGAGACSAVYKALDLTDLRLVALKTIQVYEKEKRLQMIRELSALFQLIREQSRREVSMLPTFKRPEKYIVNFYDAFHQTEDGVVCLMIEYMDGGSLQEIVDSGGCDDESSLANIAVQALKGLNFLHSCHQIHRDLKPGNFLISHRGEVKVADLGIMKQLPSHVPPPLQRTNTFVGTATYMSPERIDGKDYSYPSDVWAFGLSILTLALGKLPIETAGGYWTILRSIRDSPSPTLPADSFSPELCDFVDACLKRSPEDRLTCPQLLKHPFLKKTVPEDLTYDQSDERGFSELRSIIRCLRQHVETLQQSVRSTYPSEEDYVREATMAHSKLFGNLYAPSCSSMEVVRRLLLNDKSANNERRLTKPRLSVLARQLHLPMEKVIREAKRYCEEIEQEGPSAASD